MAVVLPFEPIVRRATPILQRAVTAVAPRARRRRTPWPPPAGDTAPLRLVPTVTALPVPEAPVREGALAAVFFPVVLLVAALDLATKAWAVAALGAGEHTALLPGLSLALVFNTASAGGVWLGEHTRAINFAATGIVIGMLTILVPHLARVERRSTIALALTAGGGLGNLTSLASSGRGVPDFLALHHRGGAWVVNVADLAIFVGLALMVGTIARLTVRVLRGERQLR